MELDTKQYPSPMIRNLYTPTGPGPHRPILTVILRILGIHRHNDEVASLPALRAIGHHTIHGIGDLAGIVDVVDEVRHHLVNLHSHLLRLIHQRVAETPEMENFQHENYQLITEGRTSVILP